MSKIEELRVKYPSVAKSTFTKFEQADKTPTKKYLEYMLKTWVTRDNVPMYVTTTGIIALVQSFDELLPYITNKDIYSKEYDFSTLRVVVERALDAKEEKTFVREEHVNVLLENDKFLLVRPKTHKGSLKYGANTRWCTAAKRDTETFKRYTRNGFLAYLIDKTGTKAKNYEKVALYIEYCSKPLNDYVSYYNSYDSSVNEYTLNNGGWNSEDLFQIMMTFRYSFMKFKDVKRDVDTVDSFMKTLSTLNFSSFEQSLQNLELNTNTDYISNAKQTVDEFLNKLKNSKYAAIG